MDFHTFLFKPDDGTGEGAPPVDAAPAPPVDAPNLAAPAPAAWAPSEQEFREMQQGLGYLVQMFQEPDPGTPDPSQDDDGEVDINSYIQQAVDARLQPVRPLLDATVKERGEKEMQKIFDRMKDE